MCIFSSKCKFHKHCSLYMSNSHTCNITGGDYGIDPCEFRPAGCYRMFERDGKNCKYYIKKQVKQQL
jgi:hypothetical protein